MGETRGDRNEIWDRVAMFSQLATRSINVLVIFSREMEKYSNHNDAVDSVTVKGSELFFKKCKCTIFILQFRNLRVAEFCDVALLFSAEMQMIAPRFLTQVGIMTNDVKQRMTKSTKTSKQ